MHQMFKLACTSTACQLLHDITFVQFLYHICMVFLGDIHLKLSNEDYNKICQNVDKHQTQIEGY